ncbi:uncharacterized protein LOC115265253 [Aedes albopictus]|uniref:Odorant receptor n=1 Tax=Aedes albopictus TaxID=7160 RepID=A0ABM1YNY5_AEDAL
MELTKVAGALISLLRMLATGQLIKPITILRCFITSNSITSGNVDYDERELAKFNRFARIIIQSIFFWVFIDTILFPFANSTGYELFRFRLPSSWVGKRASNFLNTFLVGATPVAIIPKIICCTACIGVILTGMRTKLHLLAHRFKKIVQLDPNDEQYFERVVHDLREAVDQHAVYWSYLGIMKHLVGKLFLLVHYFSVFAIGGMIFACNEMQFSFMTIIFAVSVSFFLSEYYLLCHLADSLQDEATSISNDIFVLCSQIPFKPECRSEYIQLRTTLMIVWITTCNGISVDCKGIFKINRHTFVAMLNVAYSFTTFLIQMN